MGLPVLDFFPVSSFHVNREDGDREEDQTGQMGNIHGRKAAKNASLYTGSVRVLGLFSITSAPGASDGWPHCSGSCLGGVCSILCKPVLNRDTGKLKNSQHHEGNLV